MDTPIKIVGGLSEFKEEKKFGKSLLQRIEEAQNESEIDYLLRIGETYKKASTKIVKEWNKTANKKRDYFKSI